MSVENLFLVFQNQSAMGNVIQHLKIGPLVLGSFGIMKSAVFHEIQWISCEIWQIS